MAVNAAACGALGCGTAVPPRARNPAQAILAPYTEVVAAAAVYQGPSPAVGSNFDAALIYVGEGVVVGEGRVADRDAGLVRLLRVCTLREHRAPNAAGAVVAEYAAAAAQVTQLGRRPAALEASIPQE